MARSDASGEYETNSTERAESELCGIGSGWAGETYPGLADLVARLEEQAALIEALQSEVDRAVAERTALIERAKRAWEATFDAIIDPLALVDDALCVRRANRAWATEAKLDVRQVVGVRCHEALFRSPAPCIGCPIEQLSKAGGPTSGDVRAKGRVWRVWTYPAALADGERHTICQYKDVTEERALGRQLAQAEKMAAVGQFAAGVAHEINNPLSAIIAFAQLLRREESPDREGQEYIAEIEESALRCRAILRGLLDFSRAPTEGKVRLDLKQVVQKALILVGHGLRPPAYRLQIDVPDAPVWVWGNAGDLQGVVVNLLVNAKSAMPRGGTLGVELAVSDVLAELRIADTGCGIDEGIRERIFEPFFTTKGEGEGTGLGLAIARNAIEQHGGSIGVRSQLGVGTVFVICIPLHAGP